jgi:glycerol-3-phosphate acyltransferase PlsX
MPPQGDPRLNADPTPTAYAGPVTLTLDAQGGDNAPQEIVAGALLAASPDLRVLLVGRPDIVQPLLTSSDNRYIELVPSASVITFHDEPAGAVKSMPDSSIVVGARTVAEGRSLGFISAGNTGAMLAASLLIIKRLAGVRRPAIVTTLPGLHGPVHLLDSGANADCRPEHLLEFGVLGSAYARTALGLGEPRVGLLNIGEEDSKGNELALASFALLRDSGLNFIGNVEGRDLLRNAADVVVTDGFTGNVVLKLLEGCSSALFTRVKGAAESGTRAKLGGMLLRPALRGLRTVLDPEEVGGACLLGVRGLVVICHGNSSRRAIANALLLGADALRKGMLPAVVSELARIGNSGVGGEAGSTADRRGAAEGIRSEGDA